jgi:peptidoglycan/LPS O-acetylase OafA/YrhL
MHCVALWVGYYVVPDSQPVLQTACFVALLVLLSVGSYHLLEEPLMQYGRRLSDAGHSAGRAAISR